MREIENFDVMLKFLWNRSTKCTLKTQTFRRGTFSQECVSHLLPLVGNVLCSVVVQSHPEEIVFISMHAFPAY